VEISDLDLQTSDVDGGKLVAVKGGKISFDVDGGHVEISSSDGCVTITPQPGDGQEPRICANDIAADSPELTSGPYGELVSRFADVSMGVVVVERDGRWFVSPLRTMSNALLTLVGTIERADLEPGGALHELFTGGYGLDSYGFGGIGGTESSASS
jgi:hypothetical protein